MTGRRIERDARRAERRLQLLEAALVAIRREGPGISMEAIAAEAGVTKPILYKHFGHRDGLGQALAERFAADLLNSVRSSLERDVPPEELLRSTIDAYLSLVEREPELYRYLVNRYGRGSRGDNLEQGLVGQLGRDIALVIGEQLRARGLDSGPAEPWALGIIGMVHLAGDWWLDRRTMPRARLVEYLSDLLWHGMSGMQLKLQGPG